MASERSKKETPTCQQCGKPGGRKRVDPYQLELYGERVIMRLHDQCVRDRVSVCSRSRRRHLSVIICDGCQACFEGSSRRLFCDVCRVRRARQCQRDHHRRVRATPEGRAAYNEYMKLYMRGRS